MNTKQTSMLSFFGNGSTPFEKSDFMDKELTASIKKESFFQSLILGCQESSCRFWPLMHLSAPFKGTHLLSFFVFLMVGNCHIYYV